jgi:uridine phosphorylase
MGAMNSEQAPLLANKDYEASSLFEPANLLREARRQRALPEVPVPRVAVLDPDGDVVRYLAATGRGHRHPGWACYHTDMWTVDLEGIEVGVVGMAVGAPFAVLVAEQLAVSGAELLISITSAGQIGELPATPCFVLIDRALRDEGTSMHYLPAARWSWLDATLRDKLAGAFGLVSEPVVVGDSWTTDAPYRETAAAIEAARGAGGVCVEMEAAALFAYALARGRRVVCLAHVTNTMATAGSCWKRIAAKWGPRSLLDPSPTEVEQFREEIKANAVQRRNSRGGRGTAENFIAALRCLYRHAEKDGLIKPDENPAAKTPKPRRQGATRHALSADQMSQINHHAATTGDDPELDTLLLRLHTESACRTGGALALRPRDLNTDQCVVYLREKEGTARWQPVSRSLMTTLRTTWVPSTRRRAVGVGRGRDGA